MAKLSIPISKGKDLTIEFDTDELASDDFPADVYKEIMFQGLKQVINRGFSKHSSSKQVPGNEVDKNNAALLQQAERNVEEMRAGRVRVTGGKSKTKGLDKAIMTEAMRLARLIVKDAIKREGKVKISHVPAKQITELAKAFLEGDTQAAGDTFEMAKVAIKSREEEKEKTEIVGIDLSAVVADPKLVAASEKKNKKPKAEGIVPKAKPQAQHAHH